MCGIFLSSVKQFSSLDKLEIVKRSLKNRGPDEVNFVKFKDTITMLHTRLAIQDESSAGSQPMNSYLSENVITYNGEIYNLEYLKSYLEKNYSFKAKSNCDTEILLEGFALEGKKFFEKIDGIYAFIIYDKIKEIFYVARDLLGIKPLLYSIVEKGIIMASDVNTLFEILDHPIPSKKAIVDLLSLTFIPEPDTLFENINYFEPGYLFTISKNGSFLSKETIKTSIKAKEYSKADKLKKSITNLQEIIEDSIRDQLISDSKVGLFLSSGIDSSLILAILTKLKYELRLAITLSYPPEAKGTDSQESERQASRLINEISNYRHKQISAPPSLITYQDILNYLVIEGISDPAALATFHLSKIARKNGCKVMLAGQGADELFFGYRRHKIITLYPILKILPRVNTERIERLVKYIKIPMIYSKLRRLIKLFKLFGNTPEELLSNLYTWVDKKTINKIIINSSEPSFIKEVKNFPIKNINHKTIEYLDFKYDLKSLNLRYSDRLGMYSSIEIRVPYLSLKLLKYVKSLPSNLKCNFLNTKFLLKEVSKKYLPKYITKRSKTGFSLPLQSLLRDEKQLVLETLNKENVLFNEFFNQFEVNKIVKSFYENKIENAQLIFSIYIIKKMFDKFYM